LSEAHDSAIGFVPDLGAACKAAASCCSLAAASVARFSEAPGNGEVGVLDFGEKNGVAGFEKGSGVLREPHASLRERNASFTFGGRTAVGWEEFGSFSSIMNSHLRLAHADPDADASLSLLDIFSSV
jgi:hypothetical protein